MRIDKYLWSVRYFKTRSQASEACRSGKVSVNKQVCKPSREIKTGDCIEVKMQGIIKSLEVLEELGNRVSAQKVAEFAKDTTPAEEIEKAAQIRIQARAFERREKGSGRPTKKDRREMDDFKG